MNKKYFNLVFTLMAMIMTIGCGKKDYEEYKIFSYANNKYGYVDKMDKVVIPPRYDQVKAFHSNGLAQVVLYGTWGYINAKGEWQGGSEPSDFQPAERTNTIVEMEAPPYVRGGSVGGQGVSIISQLTGNASNSPSNLYEKTYIRYIEIREEPTLETIQRYRENPEGFLKPPGTATFWVKESDWRDPDFRRRYCELVGVEKMIYTGSGENRYE